MYILPAARRAERPWQQDATSERSSRSKILPVYRRRTHFASSPAEAPIHHVDAPFDRTPAENCGNSSFGSSSLVPFATRSGCLKASDVVLGNRRGGARI